MISSAKAMIANGNRNAATYFFQWQVPEDLPLICH